MGAVLDEVDFDSLVVSSGGRKCNMLAAVAVGGGEGVQRWQLGAILLVRKFVVGDGRNGCGSCGRVKNAFALGRGSGWYMVVGWRAGVKS